MIDSSTYCNMYCSRMLIYSSFCCIFVAQRPSTYIADVGYFADSPSVIIASNGINHGPVSAAHPHTTGLPLMDSTYIAHGPSIIKASNAIRASSQRGHLKQSRASKATMASKAKVAEQWLVAMKSSSGGVAEAAKAKASGASASSVASVAGTSQSYGNRDHTFQATLA